MRAIYLRKLFILFLLLFGFGIDRSLYAFSCTSVIEVNDVGGYYACIYKRGSAFDIPKDRPIFLPMGANDGETFYFDLVEDKVQNERIRKIYKNDKEKGGPFDYCNDTYGCRFIRRGGDEVLDRAEHESAAKEIQNIKREYDVEKTDMSQAAQQAKSVSSRADVHGELPQRVYDKQILILTNSVKRDLPTITSKNAETVAKNDNYQKVVTPSQTKARDQLHDTNQGTVSCRSKKRLA